MSEEPWKRFERKITNLLVERYGASNVEKSGRNQGAGAAKAGPDVLLFGRIWLELRLAQHLRERGKLKQALSDVRAWHRGKGRAIENPLYFAVCGLSGTPSVWASTHLANLGSLFGRPPKGLPEVEADKVVVTFTWNDFLEIVDRLVGWKGL